MFFRYFTLFLINVVNIVYSLRFKGKGSFKSNYISLDSNPCVDLSQIHTHRVLFINGFNFSPNRAHIGTKYKNKLYLNPNLSQNENFNNLESPEPRLDSLVHDSTQNTHNNRTTQNSKDENYNPENVEDANRSEINELVEAALKWEKVKIPAPMDGLTERELEIMEAKFLKSLEDEDLTVTEILKRTLKEEEARQAKKDAVKEDWRDVIEEFTIEVEGKKCYGCGAHLQCKDEKKRGFVAEEYFDLLNKSTLVKCKRCSSLGSGTYFLPNRSSSKESTSSNTNILHEDGLKPRDFLGEQIFTSQELEQIQKEQSLKESSVGQFSKKERDIMNKIKEASTETVNIVRNMLRIKKKKRITILYIIDAIDPHIELGLLELIKSRQDQFGSLNKDDYSEKNPETPGKWIVKNKENEERKKRPDGGIKLYLVVNKVDLLPKYKKEDLVQYFRKMINSKVDIQLRTKNVFLISCKNNFNVNSLLTAILTEAKKFQNQILFIGPTNSGKSTLINTIHNLLNTRNTRKNSVKRPLSKDKKGLDNLQDSNISSDIPHSDELSPQEPNNNNDGNDVEINRGLTLGKKVTSSIVPGTTLGVLGIKLGLGLKIYDTPGIFVPNSFISFLDQDNLRNVIANNVCSNKSMRISTGRSLIIDKYVRIDLVGGRDFFVKAYLSSKLNLFVKKTHLIEKFISKHFPNGLIYYPTKSLTPSDDVQKRSLGMLDNNSPNVPANSSSPVFNDTEGLQHSLKHHFSSPGQEVGDFLARRFEIVLDGWDNATCDLCIKGLGFLTIGGALKINLNLYTRKEVEIYLRKPMLPKNIFPFKPRKT